MKELTIPTSELKCLTFTREMGLYQEHGTVPGSEYDDLYIFIHVFRSSTWYVGHVIVPDYFVEECNLCMNVRRWDLDTIEDYTKNNS